MKVYIERTNKEKELKFNGTVEELLQKLEINPEEVIVDREGELLINTDKVTEKDTLKIRPVISGG